MKLIINKQNPEPMYRDCKQYLILITKPFQFRWFTDCGEWFLYIHLGKRYWRFSGAGYMKGVSK
jgi:nuclear transport factor 2 (NTF2) superfamily protein